MSSGRQQKLVGSPHVYEEDESVKWSGSGISTDRRSEDLFSNSSQNKPGKISRKELREFAKKFINKEELILKLNEWLSAQLCDSTDGKMLFKPLFPLDELRKFDYALEGVAFQQLFRMPSMDFPSTSGGYEFNKFLALEDFFHVSAEALWRTFWHKDGPLPFQVSCMYGTGSKFHTAEKSFSRGRVGELCGTALVARDSREKHVKWDHVAELGLLKASDICDSKEALFSATSIGEALFYGFHILLSRQLSKSNTKVRSDSVYILVVDCQSGGMVKLCGDMNKLKLDINRIYECAADWLQHAEIQVAPMDRIWNKLGSANWRDIGTLQFLLATFCSISESKGPPIKTVTELAANHITKVQKRRNERSNIELGGNGHESLNYPENSQGYGEIVEINDDLDVVGTREIEHIKLEPGSIIWLEDSECQKGYLIQEVFRSGSHQFYSATFVEKADALFALYVGAHASRLGHSWEDMNMWYQVQRQTKVLSLMRQRGITNIYLPQLVDSGRVIHPGTCYRKESGGRCDHPCCGMPVLVTFPVGESLSRIISRGYAFRSEEALQCCHDILSALQSSASASIQHGNICPDHVIHVSEPERFPYFMLIDWGHAVLEDRDSPPINLQFSSTYALQEGKLCPSSDAESLVYLLYYLCGGSSQQFESIEAALQWREKSWSKRHIQQHLGEVSALLKAFADYVDSLCGTPYSVDYEIWIKRIERALPHNASNEVIENRVALAD